MPTNATPGRLSGCYVISLRPVGGHDAIRRAAARHGARTLALSPWRLETHGDRATRAALRAALAAPRVLFTSPAAVTAAARLRALRIGKAQTFVAVGAGTALALRRAGVATVDAPQRMDSEGLLALPSLASVRGLDIGLVTAPGGRGVIAATLAGRGARVLRANVYARVAIAPPPRAVAALRALDAPAWLLASSGEALEHIVARLPDDALAVLRRAHVVAASERLATLARGLGLRVAAVASSARPAAMLDAACAGAAAKP
ncbi:uroporphyrinogen-III synthase [Luteimonas sp. MC1828]|uniref:uroporphyrinogen-III synthase n=1 Tax=Luteimonas sp. MC1828 TaxID=2799787 RepID=UPI0018F2746B|nr:uroporphyrinogen-III synthase [Luteimonas sp. MC1828]MBJ7575356.1 uroporphyrinogen-III synthase [Luteimonas sp. MC1828]